MPVHPFCSSDAALVTRCRRGDRGAWNLLVDRFGRYVDAIARRGYRLNEADAEDVFQEVFARTYEGLAGLRDDAAIRPWIGQLTRRLCVDRLRAAKRERSDADIVIEETVKAHEERLADLEEAILVHEALAGLPADTREVLNRFFLCDQSYRTIAEEMGLPAGTIASRIARGLARLRARLEDPEAAGLDRSEASLAATA
jgi:RNA polymerase sigma-70 factor (ECF subfamily)